MFESEFDIKVRFKNKYKEWHHSCPKCGSNNYSHTLMARIFDPEHPEEYIDKNRCTCQDCGWQGIANDLIPDPSIHKVYKHNKTGNNYIMETDNFMFKENGEWKRGLILYRTAYYNPDGEYFARTKEDFEKSFTQINFS